MEETKPITTENIGTQKKPAKASKPPKGLGETPNEGCVRVTEENRFQVIDALVASINKTASPGVQEETRRVFSNQHIRYLQSRVNSESIKDI
jgi:hypothetical protein